MCSTRHQNGPDSGPKWAQRGTKTVPTQDRNGPDRNGPDSGLKLAQLGTETASSLGTEMASSLVAASASDILPHLLVILIITSGELTAIYN